MTIFITTKVESYSRTPSTPEMRASSSQTHASMQIINDEDAPNFIYSFNPYH